MESVCILHMKVSQSGIPITIQLFAFLINLRFKIQSVLVTELGSLVGHCLVLLQQAKIRYSLVTGTGMTTESVPKIITKSSSKNQIMLLFRAFSWGFTVEKFHIPSFFNKLRALLAPLKSAINYEKFQCVNTSSPMTLEMFINFKAKKIP